MSTTPSAAGETPKRKIAAGLFMSLDGVVDRPEHWGFRYMTPQISQHISAGIEKADAVLLGSRSYELFTQLWAHQSDEVPMAAFLNNSPKYVVSHKSLQLNWGPAALINAPQIASEISALKRQPGKNIQAPASPQLLTHLHNLGLLDELTLLICPVAIGSGQRLFQGATVPRPLAQAAMKLFENGVLSVTYRTQPERIAGNFSERFSK